MSNPFDYVNSINSGKSMFGTDNDELIEQKYTPYMVNRALSQFVDTVHSANEMNVNNHLDKKLQYDFLINIVRPRKRFKKWAKATEVEDLEVIKEYYGYTDAKAKEVLSVLSKDHILVIKERIRKGGVT